MASLLLLALLAFGPQVSTAQCQMVVSDAATGQTLRTETVTVEVKYTMMPRRVFCLSKALWAKLLPFSPVRLRLQCKSRYQGYWYGTDGSYRDKTGPHWVKIIDPAALTREVKKDYTVDAATPSANGTLVLSACCCGGALK